MQTINILIADDHPLFRFGMRTRLSAETDMRVVGEVGSGVEAVALTGRLAPHVVLMDLNLPELNGIDATRVIREAHPDVAVLIVTMFDDDSVFAAMRARAWLPPEGSRRRGNRAGGTRGGAWGSHLQPSNCPTADGLLWRLALRGSVGKLSRADRA